MTPTQETHKEEVISGLMHREAVVVWVVYNNPLDFPGKVVVRPHFVRHSGSVPGETLFIYGTMSEARVPMETMGLTRIHRYEDDHPCIAETWL